MCIFLDSAPADACFGQISPLDLSFGVRVSVEVRVKKFEVRVKKAKVRVRVRVIRGTFLDLQLRSKSLFTRGKTASTLSEGLGTVKAQGRTRDHNSSKAALSCNLEHSLGTFQVSDQGDSYK